MNAISFLLVASVLGADYRGFSPVQPAGNTAYADDLPERPRIDQIPFYDSSQLRSPNRSTLTDPNHAFSSQSWQPATNAQSSFGQPATYQPQYNNHTTGSLTNQSATGYSPSQYSQPQYGQSSFGVPSRDGYQNFSSPQVNQNPTWGVGSGVMNPAAAPRYGDFAQLPQYGSQPSGVGIPYRPGYEPDRNGYRDSFGNQTFNASNPYGSYGTNSPQLASHTGPTYANNNGTQWVNQLTRVAEGVSQALGSHGMPQVPDTYANNQSIPRLPDPRQPIAASVTNQQRYDPYSGSRNNVNNNGMSVTFAALLLFASLGGNIYLGWLARDFYSRYRDAVWELRSANSTSVD